MSRNIRPFSTGCDHVLQALPIVDMTVQYGCSKCGGVQDITPDALHGADYETVTAQLLAELGGTIGEPVVAPPSSFDADDAITNRLAEADIAFIEYLDTWIDKCLADGTLTIEKGARYREAIAARCAELGEVPHVREHIGALQLKAGDILGIVSPSESSALMHSMAKYTRSLLDAVGNEGVGALVFPPGTEFHVLQGAGNQVSDTIRRFVQEKLAAGVMTQEKFREMLEHEIRRQGYR